MQQLIIASNNQGKIREIKALVENIQLLSLEDVGFTDDIPEPYHTFEENALAKAGLVSKVTGKNAFADDSGICVLAFNGEPGVESAHYSGTRDDEANLQKVLSGLAGHIDRRAFYKAVICLIWDGEVYYFEGVCEGTILEEKRGHGGFGYDPIFVPDGFDQTFAELPLDVKNTISHRGKAVRKMADFLNSKLNREASSII